jgi:hypothetical protein
VKVAPCRNDPTEDRSRAYRGLVQLEQRKVGTVEREREKERDKEQTDHTGLRGRSFCLERSKPIRWSFLKMSGEVLIG